jgi:hypothetical protein
VHHVHEDVSGWKEGGCSYKGKNINLLKASNYMNPSSLLPLQCSRAWAVFCQ